MTKSQKRDIATSFTTTTFLVIAITGVMMYFHLFDNFTKSLHEILGLAFVLIVVFHVLFNWASMKNYFGKKIFLISTMVVLAISAGFVYNAPSGKSPKGKILESVINAPLELSIVVLGEDKDLAFAKLEESGIKIANSKTISDLSKVNKTSPFKIVDIIIKN